MDACPRKYVPGGAASFFKTLRYFPPKFKLKVKKNSELTLKMQKLSFNDAVSEEIASQKKSALEGEPERVGLSGINV